MMNVCGKGGLYRADKIVDPEGSWAIGPEREEILLNINIDGAGYEEGNSVFSYYNVDSQTITHTPKDNIEIVDCRKILGIARALNLFIKNRKLQE